jgi:hypothetical protein
MRTIIHTWNRINRHPVTEWCCRILFSAVMLAFVLHGPAKYCSSYPDIGWLLWLISLWMYFFKWRITALILLALGVVLILQHIHPYIPELPVNK